MIILTGGSIILGGQIILRMIGPGCLFFLLLLLLLFSVVEKDFSSTRMISS